MQGYLLREIQNVYRSQGVAIDDKHIEIILAQMMRKVQVEDPGDSEFLPGAVVDKFRFRRENERLRKERKKPATGQTLLLGITKASLSSDSFISAASFQETTKVLTEAAHRRPARLPGGPQGERDPRPHGADRHRLPRPPPHAREEEHRLRRDRRAAQLHAGDAPDAEHGGAGLGQLDPLATSRR